MKTQESTSSREKNETKGNDIGKCIIYEQTLPFYEKPEDSAATLIIILNQKRFQDVIQSMQSANGGWGLVLDGDNRVLFSTDSFVSNESFISICKKLSNDEGLLYERVNNRNVVISYVTSQMSKWKYISVIPSEIFWSKVDFIKRLTLFSILLCLILGTLASYFFTRKNYNPVNELVHLLDKGIGTLSGKRHNEYRFIKDEMTNIISENKEINGRLKQQKAVLQSNFLIKLIKGKYHDSDFILKTLPIYDISFDSDNFAVMLFPYCGFQGVFRKLPHI